jgi:eukaryotic-like serine/threonine-protein kinase
MADAPAPPVVPGDVVAGKYRVERIIGKGGMGIVVAAKNVKLDQEVALKFLTKNALEVPGVVERFEREARAAARIRCEHVARVLDVDALPDGLPYIVMEMMHGDDLRRILVKGGPLPTETAVTYILQACEALAEAHVAGIVHRDLKPANLFLATRPSGEPIIKVLDFGISKATLSDTDPQLTQTSSLMGTPSYMSPEQMASPKTVDPRSDIWSVGIVLYEMLGGRTPFKADTMPELILSIVTRAHEPIRSLRDSLPPGLAAVVDRCLQKKPRDRYANVAELARALAPFGPPQAWQSVERIAHVLGSRASDLADDDTPISIDEDVPARDLTGPETAAALGTSVPLSAAMSGPPQARRPFRPLVVAGAAALLLLVAVIVLRPGGSPDVAVAAPGVAAAPVSANPPPATSPPLAVAEPAPMPQPAPVTTPAPAPKGAQQLPPPRPTVRPISPGVRPAAVDCSVPFTVDAQGHRIPKPECL